MGLFSPKEIVAQAENAAIVKTGLPVQKVIVLGLLAGVYIAMGGLLSVLIGFGFPEINAANPGLQKLLSGICFPIGLILVMLAGAELFTGNNAVLIPGAMSGKYKWSAVVKNWVLVYFSNFAGALFFGYVMIYLAGILEADPWHSAIIKIAEGKVSMDWWTVFVKGIGANWLVCLAVWLGFSSKTAGGKFFGLWFPIMCFVAIGYEHSIANMFFIPTGMLYGAGITPMQFVFDNLIPATLGNIAGGAIFVGLPYWYAYAKK